MPHLRLIVGPNGSGKTTLTKTLRETYSVPLGQYLNPDDIAKHIDLPGIFVGNGELMPSLLFFDNSTTILTFIGEVTPDGYLDIVEASFDKVQARWFYGYVIKLWNVNQIER
ncbi:EutP/PduV family microcompartment system protein [Brenneria populi]|uniref:EutP/PduV family microcompartment system protein n=1 Tax=Brenneria populi TaxID=1505588 RepID=A0ABU6JMI0_9GAMM|nr:EutP/PduV family microcompartment system protein [Brenneria populi Li et al. 2015]